VICFDAGLVFAIKDSEKSDTRQGVYVQFSVFLATGLCTDITSPLLPTYLVDPIVSLDASNNENSVRPTCYIQIERNSIKPITPLD
jgi:hypothetical protein